MRHLILVLIAAVVVLTCFPVIFLAGAGWFVLKALGSDEGSSRSSTTEYYE